MCNFNSSLWYEVILYINSFYFGLFAMCELGALLLKSIVLLDKYDVQNNPMKIARDYGILLAFLLFFEPLRLYLGRKGSLNEKNIPVFISVFLVVPCSICVLYLWNYQVVTLQVEYFWCAIMFSLHTTELYCASVSIVSMCRGPSYD